MNITQRSLIWNGRKTVKKVTKTIVPITLYNVVVQHHDFTVQEVLQNAFDTMCIDVLTQAMDPLHSDIHRAHAQMKEYLERVGYSNKTRHIQL